MKEFTVEQIKYLKPFPKLGKKCFLQLANGEKITNLVLLERGKNKKYGEYVILRCSEK